MKLGRFALKVLVKYLKGIDKERRKKWPDFSIYKQKQDVDALGDGNFFHQFDVFYAPKEKRTGRVLVDIHGGAYIFSDRKSNQAFASAFLEKGYDVVLLDYMPNNGKRNCLQQIQTLAGELAYLQTHAEELSLDADKFYLTGDSAGGHFALFLAECSQNIELSSQIGVNLHGIRFHAVALNCPVYDFRRSVMNPKMSHSGKKLMFGPCYKQDAIISSIDPRQHLDSITMPVFVSSCKRDFLQQESNDLFDDVTAADKSIEFVFIKNDDKAVDHVHNVTDINLPESIQVNDAMDAFFQKH